MNSDAESCASESMTDDSMNLENPDDFPSRYPKPFRGHEDENIYDFIKNMEEAFHYNRVPASNRVIILKRLMQDDAEYAVCEKKSLDEIFKYLKWLFGNPVKFG